MTPEEKAQAEKEAAEKETREKANKTAEKAAADEAAALGKLTAEQDKLAKEQVKLHEKFAADQAKRPVKVEDLPELLPTSPENEWKDREKLLKDQEKK